MIYQSIQNYTSRTTLNAIVSNKESSQACAECPASYAADPASGLLCSLWIELENKEAEAGDSGDDSDLVSTSANLGGVTCVYGGHGTSAGDLCDLWCQIQLLEVRSLCHNC